LVHLIESLNILPNTIAQGRSNEFSKRAEADLGELIVGCHQRSEVRSPRTRDGVSSRRTLAIAQACLKSVASSTSNPSLISPTTSPDVAVVLWPWPHRPTRST